MTKMKNSLCLVLILLLVSACGSNAPQSYFPTPVFIPVIVTVGIPVPVTVTPSNLSTDIPSNGAAQTLVTQTQKKENIEEDATNWHVYEDHGDSVWVLQNVDSPSLHGKSLQCSITGGDAYSGVHCYREFDPIEKANAFKLDLAFQFTPATTCNNVGVDSVVQAIEFSMSKWEQSQRYEFAVQWQNVGDGAPQWRYWDPSQPDGAQWVPINSDVKYCLKSDQWHTLALEGDIVEGQVHYKSFTVDNSTQALDITVPPAKADTTRDYLAVAVQVDSNSVPTSYDLFIDNINFAVEQKLDCNSIAVLQENTEFTFQGNSDFLPFDDPSTGETTNLYIVEKNAKVTWDPACLMDLQYYQSGNAVLTKKDAASGQYDFNDENIQVGVDTELKIWRGGEIIKSMWVRVRE